MDDLMDIRDIAPPIETLARASVWPWVIVALLVIVVGLYFFLRKSKPQQVPETVVALTPLELTLQYLDALMSEMLIENGKTKEYFTKLNMILRVYLRKELDIDAPFRTTSELLESGDCDAKIDDSSREYLVQFLKECDLFKFASISAQPDIARNAHDVCRKLVIALAGCGEES